MSFLFEIHCHTSESSACASQPAEATVRSYKERGYDGIVITDHLGIGMGKDPWKAHCVQKQAGYYAAKDVAEKYGIKVLYGAEITVKPFWGNDFLCLGLEPQWYLDHPELDEMDLYGVLAAVREAGGFISHAHPFREANYIKSIVLVPRSVDAVEINANRSDFENERAAEYAKNYSLPLTAGSDNHSAHNQKRVFGMRFDRMPQNEKELAQLLFEGAYTPVTE